MLYNQDWNRKPNPVSEVLLKAADLLEKHGHTKNILKNSDGSMCFMGALNMAETGDAWFRNPELAVKAATITANMLGVKPVRHYLLSKNDPFIGVRAIVDWNNAKERTAQEVIDAMRAAAKIAEQETADAV